MFRRLVRALIPALIGAAIFSACAAPASPAPTETTVQTEATEMRELRVLCVGDSNTYGYDPRDGGRYEAGQRWTGRLVRDDRTVINQGINGETLPYGDRLSFKLEQIEAGLPADLVIVMLGTNDILCGFLPEECGEAMDLLIAAIRDLAPEAEILLICPPATPLGDPEARALFAARYAELERVYRALAERISVGHADANAWEIGLGGDELHFSLDGHAVFADEVDALISQIFAETEKNS